MEARLSEPERPQLASFARVDLRGLPDRLERVLGILNAAKSLVVMAYAELAVTFEKSVESKNGDCRAQRYLSPAPDGIGARPSWGMSDLSYCRLIDVEGAWSLHHNDIANSTLEQLNAMNAGCAGCVNHGTSVLGVVAAKANDLGGTGVAPEIPSIGLVSTWRESDSSDGNVANAVVAAIGRWASERSANVLLLEVQRGNLLAPTEIDWCDWHAIRCAVAHGMTVIECAGNGKLRINRSRQFRTDEGGIPGRLTIDGLELNDSGAIIVGGGAAMTVDGTHPRLGSNSGSRIDCYAWSECIFTTGKGKKAAGTSSPIEESFRGDFGGTSGAAAIVAGAALLTQGMNWELKKAFVTPAGLRRLFRRFGTKQLNPRDGPVGVMPNLEQIRVQL
jgi:hypothetical protein